MGLIFLVDKIFRIYTFLIFARVILSYIPIDRNSPFVVILVRVTEPVLAPCRDLFNSLLGALKVDTSTIAIDFSPLIAYLVIDWLIRPAVLVLLSAL